MERVRVKGEPKVRLLGAGAILREVIAAAERLDREWGISSEVWSVTSFSELAREAREVERWNRLHPQGPARFSYLESCLGGTRPIIAATDYVRAYPQLVGTYLQARYITLGTDGFGRSDTRRALRQFFEVDQQHVVLAALQALSDCGELPAERVTQAIASYGLARTSRRPGPARTNGPCDERETAMHPRSAHHIHIYMCEVAWRHFRRAAGSKPVSTWSNRTWRLVICLRAFSRR